MNRPSQLPAFHAEDASAGLGMAFLVTSIVHVGSLDGAELSCVRPHMVADCTVVCVTQSPKGTLLFLKARMIWLFITSTNNKASADIYHKTVPHKC